MVDRKKFDKVISKQAIASFLVFLALYFGSRFLNGESAEASGFVLGFSVFIPFVLFVRNVLSELIVIDSKSAANEPSKQESTVEG